MRTLSALDYYDPGIYARERSAIFEREWLCLGSSTPVHEPNSFVAETVAGWPVVVVRDADGVLRAFHNVCRHRAGPLVNDGEGTCRTLVCRYHGWSYGLDGVLRSARDSTISAADLDGVGLFEIRAATWRGLLFVGIDPALPPIEDWLGTEFIERCADFPMEFWTPATRLAHSLSCNWKTYSDNYLEGYHIPFVHPELARVIDPSSYLVEVHDRWVRHSAATREGSVATGMWLYHWPNLALNLYEHGMSVERWYPTGASSCTLVLDFLFADSGPEAIARNQLDIDASVRICAEDKAICEAVQRNLTAGIFTSGFLAPGHESGVADFQRRVRWAIDTADRPSPRP